jgi:hypothetical protein
MMATAIILENNNCKRTHKINKEIKRKKERRRRRTLELAMRASRNIYPTKKKKKTIRADPSREQTTPKTKPMKTKIKCMGLTNKAGKK